MAGDCCSFKFLRRSIDIKPFFFADVAVVVYYTPQAERGCPTVQIVTPASLKTLFNSLGLFLTWRNFFRLDNAFDLVW